MICSCSDGACSEGDSFGKNEGFHGFIKTAEHRPCYGVSVQITKNLFEILHQAMRVEAQILF